MARQFLTKIAFSAVILMLLSMVVVAFGALVPEAAYAASESAVLSTGSQTGWQKVDGKWYYYTNNGELKKGWLLDGGKWYYLDKDYGYMHAGESYRVDSKAYLFSTSGALVTKKGWYYAKNSYSNAWYYIKNSDGELHLGWLKDGGTWYYLDESYGHMCKNTAMNEGSKYYLLSSSGAMVTKLGWHAIKLDENDTEWYYIKSSNGELHTGWLKDGGLWYFMSKTGGAMFHDCCKKANEKPYLFSKSGAVVTKVGWHSTTTKDPSGYEHTNWHYVKNSNGDLHEGWLQDGGKWYYLNSSGYMNNNGSSKVGSKLYLFSESGSLVTKTGWASTTYQGSTPDWYYVKNSDGELFTGWKKTSGKWYYLEKGEDGRMLRNTTRTIDGKTYTFDASGALVED